MEMLLCSNISSSFFIPLPPAKLQGGILGHMTWLFAWLYTERKMREIRDLIINVTRVFMENAKRSPCGNDQCYSSLIKENEDKETCKWFVLQFLVLLISLHTQHTPEELLQSPQSLLDISFVRLSRLILTAIHSCGRLHTTTDQLSLRERERPWIWTQP